MVHAFVMVKTAAGLAESVRDDTVELDTVSEAHVVAGEFDVLAEASVDDVRDLLSTVSTAIQGIDGVLDTKTYLSMSN